MQITRRDCKDYRAGIVAIESHCPNCVLMSQGPDAVVQMYRTFRRTAHKRGLWFWDAISESDDDENFRMTVTPVLMEPSQPVHPQLPPLELGPEDVPDKVLTPDAEYVIEWDLD